MFEDTQSKLAKKKQKAGGMYMFPCIPRLYLEAEAARKHFIHTIRCEGLSS